MRSLYRFAAALALAVPSVTHAHFGQRVWVDVDSNNKIKTFVGPPADGPPLSAGQFSQGRVFARDMGTLTSINYTALLKPYVTYNSPSLIPSDHDADDDGQPYATNFPGYELKPFASFTGSTTFNVSIVGQPLFYSKAAGNTPASLQPVSTAFAGHTLPYFTVGTTLKDPLTGFNYTQEARSPTDNSTVFACPAFTVGGHGHPDISLFPNIDDPLDVDANDLSIYRGVYALVLQLDAPGLTASDPFMFVLGNEAPVEDILEAARFANDAYTAVPEPGSLSLFVLGAGLLMRRRSRPR